MEFLQSMRIFVSVRKITLFFLIVTLCWACTQSRTSAYEPYPIDKDSQLHTYVFWNVENAFDTIDDPHASDHEFTPQSKREWNRFKYRDKINKIAEGIRATGKEKPATIVGLAEIENANILKDLLHSPPLENTPYQWVHCPSNDPRGIDLGLLYDTTQFMGHNAFSKYPLNQGFWRSRPIVWIEMYTFTGDTLDVFLNHWSSKRGGKKAVTKRGLMARRLSQLTDSLSGKGRNYLLVMGDFNESPTEENMKWLQDSSSTLVNLVKNLPGGTHFYRGHWAFLDQIWVSKALAKGYLDDSAEAIKEEMWMEYSSKYKTEIPFRSWKGSYYQGGFSDHLPVRAQIYFPPEN